MGLHKLRSILAVSCIIVGTFAVVTLIALSNGFYQENSHNMLDMVDGSFYVFPGHSSYSYQGYPPSQINNITIEDIEKLPTLFKNIEAASPIIHQPAKIQYRDNIQIKNVYGVTGNYSRLRKIDMTNDSRFINQTDIENQTSVVFIGNKIKNIFFGQQNALGKKIFINNVPFTVIGISEDDQSSRHDSISNRVIISYRSYMALYKDHSIKYFCVLPTAKTDTNKFEQSLRAYFGQKYHFDKNDKDALYFWDTKKVFNYLFWFLNMLRLFLATCGIMTLAVGSIGVANIMFLIVTERTFEIGLRKAIGASNKQIFQQLLLETLIIIGMGGSIGFALSFATISLIQHINLPNWLGTPIISWTTVAITILVLLAVGLIAGFFPARRAAQLDPIEALARKN